MMFCPQDDDDDDSRIGNEMKHDDDDDGKGNQTNRLLHPHPSHSRQQQQQQQQHTTTPKKPLSSEPEHELSSSPTHTTSAKQLSIPSDRNIDYPLKVFQRYRKQQQQHSGNTNKTTSPLPSPPLFDAIHATINYDENAIDYRAFALLIHPNHGAILLHCTRKKKKPPHYQLPGGHVDQEEFQKAAAAVVVGRNDKNDNNDNTDDTKRRPFAITQQQLYLAARMACAREIYEETSIDLRNSLDRLLPMMLVQPPQSQPPSTTTLTPTSSSASANSLVNEYKHRIFFVAQVHDADFCPQGQSVQGSVRYATLPQETYSVNLMLQLSVEHSGFRFCNDSPQEIVDQLQWHSGGKVSQAIAMAYSI